MTVQCGEDHYLHSNIMFLVGFAIALLTLRLLKCLKNIREKVHGD